MAKQQPPSSGAQPPPSPAAPATLITQQEADGRHAGRDAAHKNTNDHGDGAEKAPSITDWIVAYSAVATAAFTLILMGATVVLALFTYRLWQATKEAVGDTTEALALSQRQFLLMGRQTDIIEKQHAVDRLDYLATHRPQITIHAVKYIAPPTGNGDGKSVIGASFVCFNTGTNIAKKVEIRAEYVMTWNIGVDVERPKVAEFEDIPLGGKFDFSVVSGILTRNGPIVDEPPISCVGTIAYWDEGGHRREAGFCVEIRHSHPPTWMPITNDQLNYEY